MRRILMVSFLIVVSAPAWAQFIGPSTSVMPYLLPSNPSVSTTSVLTVNDPVQPSVGGYKMVGIPDGLGAFVAENQSGGAFTLMMNHELGGSSGFVRAHGSTGAFVSRWTLNPDLTVTTGRDHNTSPSDVYTWNGSQYVQGTTAFNRFCSADLPAPGAFQYNGLGTSARILMNGEETGAEGRAFAHVVSGGAVNTSWQLPALGRYSWENAVPSPYGQAKTVVMGLDDSNGGQVYAYVGNKTNSGTDVERAGLTNGQKYGIRVPGMTDESTGFLIAPNTPFELAPLGDVTNLNGAALEAASDAAQVTGWLRPEDGAWDPRPGHENDFYFVNTSALTQDGGRSRLYRLSFQDITQPELGGTITALLDGTEGGEMLDNLCIDSHGRVLIQEDPGNASRLSKVWLYDIDSGNLAELAEHNSDFFLSGAPNYLTQNEESSGIIDAKDFLGDGWFLLDVQAHYSLGGELVEGGQLLTMYVDPSFVPEPASLTLLALAGAALLRRR
jgi:hypothetical protein